MKVLLQPAVLTLLCVSAFFAASDRVPAGDVSRLGIPATHCSLTAATEVSALGALQHATIEPAHTLRDFIDAGFAHMCIGQYDAAIVDFTGALELQPDQILAVSDRAVSYSLKGARRK